MNLKYLLTILLLFCSSMSTFSQETIEEAKKRADQLFQDEKYAEAMPVYLRLLADSPRDFNMNYRYGTCLLYNPSKNQDVFKYLNYAVTGPDVEVEANYFLARAYHLNYQFNDALKYYQIYQQKAGANAKPSLDVKRQIEMCNNGKKLITTITEMIVIDKKEIEKDKFFRIYDLSDIGGNLLVTAEFQTKLDEKKGHIPLIHFPANPTVIYYSSYGETGKTGKDIYVQRRLPTGGWGIPQMLQGGVNTNFDEDYPYMHPDGQYIYFSSKGHNSMGGYDVFRCKYDAETDMFGLAENMDFAVSSPNDDLFYVVDSLNRNAYFGSNRQSEEGKLNVYKVRVDRVPLNMTVIKGEFTSAITPALKKVLIDVKDYASGEFIGNFNSNDKGFYLITFPKGGKYEMTIKVGDNPQEYKYIVSIPFQKEFKPLKQKIVHEMMGENENVKVIDLFNEAVEDPQAVFAQVIRMKSVLTPNSDKFNLDELDKERKSKEVLNELGIGKLSLVEVGYLLEEEVKDAQKAENGTKDLENKLHTQVVNNAAELARLDAIIKSKMEKVNTADTDKKKYRLLKEVERALKTQEEIKIQSEKSIQMADSLSKIQVTGSPEQTAAIKKYSDQFNELMKENKQKEAYAFLYDNKEALKKIIDEKTPDPLQSLIDRGLVLDDEIDRLQPKDDEYAQQIKKIDQDITTLENSKITASKKEIEKIDAQIKSKKAERQMVVEERNFNAVGLNQKIEERSSIRKQVDVLESLYALDTKKVISKEELSTAVSTTNSINPGGTKSRVSSQINQLVLSDPTIKDVDYADMESELGSIATSTKNQADRVKTDPNLTPQQKAAKLKDLDRQLLSSINSEMAATKKALNANPNDPSLKTKLETLQNARSIVSASLDVPDEDNADVLAASKSSVTIPAETGQNTTDVNSQSVSNPSSTPTVPLDAKGKENLIESVNSSYNEKVAQIKVNENLSPLEKLNQLQQADKELLASVEEKIDETETKLKQNPGDASLMKELSDLKTVRNELESTIASRDITIASTIQSGADLKSPVMATQLTAQQKESIIESVSPTYNENVVQINNNTSLSETEKLNKLQQADKGLLTSIEKEITSVEADLKSKPGDATLTKELADLKAIQSELESAIASRENTLSSTSASVVSGSMDAKEKEILVESISPTYNEKVSQINSNASLSESQKLEQLQQEDKKLLASLNDEILKVEADLKKNPTDTKLADKLSDLKIVKSEIESTINNRDSVIASTGQPLTQKEKTNIIDALNPSYNVKVAEINKNNKLSEGEKLTQLQQADKELISSINKEIAALESNIKNNPDPQLTKELADYKSIKAELESAVASRDTQLTALNGGGSTFTEKEKENLIESFNPAYNEKITQINSNSGLSEKEKLTQLQQIDKELLASLDKELSKVEADFKKNPNDPVLAQKMTDLTVFKSELKSDIEEREMIIANSPDVKSPITTTQTDKQKEALIESINPAYNEKIAQINNNSTLSESEKLFQLQQADKDLLTTINKELVNLDPTSKMAVDLKALKTELESDITARESVIASTHKPLDAAVKSEMIKSIDSKYDKKVDAVNNDKELSTSEKLDKLQEIDYNLISEVNTEIAKVDAAIAKNPTDANLTKKSDDLHLLKAELEATVTSRESVIASSSGATMDEKIKTELVESVKPNYNEKVDEVKNNEYMLDTEKQQQYQKLDKDLMVAIDQEIANLEKDLASNPSNALAKRKIEQLTTLKTELQAKIDERQKMISPSAETNPLAVKADLIEKLSSGYNEKVDLINSDAFLTDLEKQTQLQELDKELMVIINKELTKATKASKSKPKDETLKTAKQELAELKTLAEDVIAKREVSLIEQKSASVTAEQKSDLVTKVKPDHETKIQQINDSNAEQSVKIQDLLKEENALLAKLETEQKVSLAAIKKAPRDEKLKSQDNVISVTKSETEKRISELNKEAVTLKALTIDQPALVSKVDPTYEAEIKDILNSNSPTKSADLAAREVKHQESITAKIEENEMELASKYNLDLAAENQILAQKLKESKIAEERYRGGATKAPDTATTNPVTPVASNEKQAKIDEIRKELLGDKSGEVTKTYTNVEDLKRQEETLINYSDALSNRLQSVNDQLASSGSDPELLEEKSVLETEITTNDSKVKRLATAIEQMEGATSEERLTSPELEALTAKENAIKEKLNNPNLSSKEKSALEKELAQIQVEKKKEENNLMTTDIAKRQAAGQQKTAQLNQLGATSEMAKTTTDLANSQSSRLSGEASELVAQSVKEKDPVAKNEILAKAMEKQIQADAVIADALVENTTRAAIKNQVTTLDSKEDLEQKIRRYSVEIGELEKQISDLDTEIAASKPKKAEELKKTKETLTAELELTKKELEDLERLKAETEITEIQHTIKPNALDKVVSFEEEKQIIASEDYMKYSIDANSAVRLEGRIAETEVMLTEKRNISKELIAMSLDKNSKITQEDVRKSVENVKIAEDTLAALKEKLSVKQNELSAYNGDLEKMQNLVKRGVTPKFNPALAKIEENRPPLAGITIVDKPSGTYSEKNPIPVDVKNHSGLVYRIQVGAFSKPIPQDMYNAFSPVTGEKLVSGVTRYMAGYFSKSAVVEDAHAKVRSLGYSDAFIVAYCDEERIPLVEAKRLEASGECINTKSEEFIIAMKTTPEAAPVEVNLTYNQGPDAVKAEPAEAHLGLFYTVQVGVYNKPATAKQVKNISPLVTKRLPNGQIRYSTGMFTSIAEATPKKAEARAKGVHDAFITAYYKGERITLSQASHLLRLHGNEILEKVDASANITASETTPVESTPKESTVVKVETPKGASPEEVKASAYNKGPGAVPATAVETRLGLFFTVQIGVYSKPATMKQLNYVSPLITKKLPNGQIRYSTGMFTSVEAAEPKRKEALAKGVKHAYVTAYYKGERITIAEAKELLNANGESILEKLDK